MSKNLATTLALSAATMFLATACDKSGETTTPEPAAASDSATDAGGELASDVEGDAKVKCLGVNECKGQGQCDMPTHSCAGQNECKGKGWVLLAGTECSDQGGTVKA